MKKLESRLCQSCNCSFNPLAQHKQQKFCSKKKCQNDRKNRATKYKLKTDPAYRENQASANKTWRQKNPDYQKNYRKKQKLINNLKSIGIAILFLLNENI